MFAKRGCPRAVGVLSTSIFRKKRGGEREEKSFEKLSTKCNNLAALGGKV